MNDCGPTRTLLRAWLAEQLPEEERAEVAAHLEACGSCSALRRTYQATVTMSTWPEAEIPLPEGLNEAVLEAVRLHKQVPEPDPEAEMPENAGTTAAPAPAPPEPAPARRSRRPPRRSREEKK